MASENAGVAGLAGRYAGALFDLALEHDALGQAEADLTALRAMMADSADLQRFVTSPVVTRGDQIKGINAVAQAAGVSEMVRNFLGLVAGNRRLFALPAMITAFLDRLAAHRGEASAEIIAARPLTDTQHADLVRALAGTTGGTVAIKVTVDPTILGGLVVRVGSRMVDSSLRTKLQRLQLAMKGVG